MSKIVVECKHMEVKMELTDLIHLCKFLKCSKSLIKLCNEQVKRHGTLVCKTIIDFLEVGED